MQDYRQLSVWRKAHALALNIHRLSESIPHRDNAGLIGQIRRASLSIPANIAEGSGREGDKDFIKFLQIAVGSATELEYHLQFAADTAQIPRKEFESRHAEVIEIRRMLFGLIRSIRARPVPSPLVQS